jgi:hypothetical protein
MTRGKRNAEFICVVQFLATSLLGVICQQLRQWLTGCRLTVVRNFVRVNKRAPVDAPVDAPVEVLMDAQRL